MDMVHESLKDLKLEVPPDDTTLTLRDAVTRKVQWRWTSIDVDPSTAGASASTTTSQPNTTLASIFPETHLSPSPFREELRPSLIVEESHLSPIQEQSWKSPIRAQSWKPPPRTQSTSLTAPDQTRPSSVVPKMMKATKGKKPQQRKMSSKAIKVKQPLIQPAAMMQANLKFLLAMTQSNLKFVMGKLMLTVFTLHKAGQPCVDLHNYYINNYKLDQDIIVSYKDRYFLVGDGVFFISFPDLYDLFNFDMLDVSLMRCFAL
jgi:hypothetical protein